MEFPYDKQPAIRVFAMPADTNSRGDIFGGWLMSQVDLAGSVAAFRTARCRVATVAVNSFQFIKPVFVGDLVSIFSDVTKIGNTSIQVTIHAFAERVITDKQVIHVAEAVLTYVAIDNERRPVSVKQ